jgi:hypothetical protein
VASRGDLKKSLQLVIVRLLQLEPLIGHTYVLVA